MNRRHLITVITLLLLPACVGYAQQPFHAPTPSYPVVSSHRGGWGPERVENSMAAFRAMHERVPDAWIELDVAMSADSVLFLLHDFTLDRVTTGSGAPDSLTWRALSQLPLVDVTGDTMAYGLTLFNEVLDWARGRTVLVIDPKPSVTPSRVAAAIDSADMNRDVIVITDNLADARAYHRANRELTLQVYLNSPTSDSVFDRYINDGIPESRLTAVVPLYSRENAEAYSALFARLRIRGMAPTLLVFDIDDVAQRDGFSEYVPYLEDGAMILATDLPALALMAVRTYKAMR